MPLYYIFKEKVSLLILIILINLAAFFLLYLI